jgi:uncharacterized protein (DUF302 family)
MTTASAYGIGAAVRAPHERVVELVRQALQAEGFGVLSEIDVRATLKRKLDLDVPPYLILGACNPALASQALREEADVGLLLPCNVVVYEEPGGRTRVAALDPIVQLGLTNRKALVPIAREARERLVRVVRSVAKQTQAVAEEAL